MHPDSLALCYSSYHGFFLLSIFPLLASAIQDREAEDMIGDTMLDFATHEIRRYGQRSITGDPVSNSRTPWNVTSLSHKGMQGSCMLSLMSWSPELCWITHNPLLQMRVDVQSCRLELTTFTLLLPPNKPRPSTCLNSLVHCWLSILCLWL